MIKLTVGDDSHDKISINQQQHSSRSEVLKLAEHINVAAAARELILYVNVALTCTGLHHPFWPSYNTLKMR